MDNDGFDASVGLAFSLELFQRYRQDGVLQAKAQRIPGIRGHCIIYIHLVKGEVITCYIVDSQGQQHSSNKNALLRLDNEKGPFEWTFHQPSRPAPAAVPQEQRMSPTARLDMAIPRIIDQLDLAQQHQWTTQQKGTVYLVMSMINGQRNVGDIKAKISLPASTIEEVLRALMNLHVITIDF